MKGFEGQCSNDEIRERRSESIYALRSEWMCTSVKKEKKVKSQEGIKQSDLLV